jgi:uncharacterized protein with PQ loop repeat
LSSHLRLGLSCWLFSGYLIKTTNVCLMCRRFPTLCSYFVLDLLGLSWYLGDKLAHFSYAV